LESIPGLLLVGLCIGAIAQLAITKYAEDNAEKTEETIIGGRGGGAVW
jgi:hypothetical protein